VKPVVELARSLAAGNITSRRLVEQAIAAIRDAAGEGSRTFIAVHEADALAAADRVDARRRDGEKLPVLAGIPISIKDNIDEAHVTTLAASTVLIDSPAAARDAGIVARLRNAGAILLGRTNMSEFAYSGLGINPHYGTPRNVFDRAAARIPGGSSSGAAISVADGMAAAAIGTDTGGSVRIPAALNGLVGFKPTARRVPLDGVVPLSTKLDSAGPLARTVADCALLDRILAADADTVAAPLPLRDLRLAVPQTVFLDDLSEDVANAFAAALHRLSAAGAQIIESPMPEFAHAAEVNSRGALVSAEAFAWHRRWIETRREKYDPRVISRILPGSQVSPQRCRELLRRRACFVAEIEKIAGGYDAMLMPATPETAPAIADVVRDDASYLRFNSRMLRNASIVNAFDGCALSIPCHEPGAAPIGLMIAGIGMADRRILGIGWAAEAIVSPPP
jgi:aspartyl-tRNA(Asn)/glutamyl-tRNA(Gln) amidotransferase subunit A